MSLFITFIHAHIRMGRNVRSFKEDKFKEIYINSLSDESSLRVLELIALMSKYIANLLQLQLLVDIMETYI